ncbi:hypothetical protein TNIN_462461 [Trichonephila inaurata madagascariensis]|uniref:Uncharacterized protein n=1 Tax=Trichonephila inaurata madagascariensis TaxID=2747483 RepID=A0A8X6JHQ2_9ARAC|nr:hypothetical protein TNIN_462461 [Trichonephila inaurata madagascariensis]
MKRCKIKKTKNTFPKRRQKRKSVSNRDHRVLVNHERRKKEDVPLKTCHTDRLGPHRIAEIEEGVMEQTVQFQQDLQ